MLLKVSGSPRLHPLFGFSVNFQTIELSGEGTIKKAFELLLKKLTLEGLFDDSRKRRLPYPPQTIGLITSRESAAYADFTKIINARWQGCDIRLADVQVQGEVSPGQIARAVEWFNHQAELVDVLVVIRGGGSADDLQSFSTETVTRAVAASRIPTLVAIGHEIDLSLAEMAADRRASTPSNAAELLVPDRQTILEQLSGMRQAMAQNLNALLALNRQTLTYQGKSLDESVQTLFRDWGQSLQSKRQYIELLNPKLALQRGYAIIRKDGRLVRSGSGVKAGDELAIHLTDATIHTTVTNVKHGKTA
jgi:exodeoxyribonuclease VII large subunit